MFPYVAVLWNDAVQRQRDAARAAELLIKERHSSWVRKFHAPGVSVYCPEGNTQGGEAIVLPDAAGVLLGIAFSKDAASPALREGDGNKWLSSRSTVNRLVDSCGRAAIDSLWGAYVLVLKAGDGRARYVLRSPMSQLPCFYAHYPDGIFAIFSVVDDCPRVTTRGFTINWPVIRAQSAQGAYLTRETALNGVWSLECGECIKHDEAGLTRSIYWNPCKISQGIYFPRFEDAVSSLRNETLRAVHSWSSRYKAILLRLSGGLDSSIVLGGLATAPTAPRIVSINFYNAGLHMDEREFARSMTAKARTPLLEIDGDAPWDLSLFTRCARTARPVLNLTAPGRVHAIAALAQQNQVDAVFDGELGDDVFGYQPGATALAAYLKHHGPSPGALRVARDIARLKRLSIWHVLLSGISQSLRDDSSAAPFTCLEDSAGTVGDSFRFATREVVEEYHRDAKRFVHPWFEGQTASDPSALGLIEAIIMVTSTAYHFPFSVPFQPNYIHPLVSQPLIEAALQIPSYFCVRQGWNRAVARTAFSDLLSDEVRFRNSKTDMTPWVRRAVRDNLPWLREFLLDGVLSRENIIDKARIESVLSDTVNDNTTLINHIFSQLYIEGWLRQWTS